MLVIAHATHWISYVLFLGPMLTFVVWLVLVSFRDRRAMRDEEAVAEAEGTESG